jgi:adenylate cyclase
MTDPAGAPHFEPLHGTSMFVVTVQRDGITSLEITHDSGPLEFGRSVGQNRIALDDPYVSRKQLRIQEEPDGRVRITNLSEKIAVTLSNGQSLDPKETCVAEAPQILHVGQSTITVTATEPSSDDLQTIARPITIRGFEGTAPGAGVTEPRTVDEMGRWFERLLTIQRAATGSTEFYTDAARAIVELIGLDRGLVLLRRNADWTVAGQWPSSPGSQTAVPFSRTILQHVVDHGETVFRSIDRLPESASLMRLDAAVASPIFSEDGSVIGAVYGSRDTTAASTGGVIEPLHAQLTQVLAAAIGTGLARLAREVEAARLKTQFELFFTRRLADEILRNPDLLKPREQVVTVLFCDVRGFTGIAERMGTSATWSLISLVMDALTDCVTGEEGVIVDYYGDGLCAMWNAPIAQVNHAARAARVALRIPQQLPEINAAWESRLGRPVEVGVGINTGPAQIGNSGSRRRLKYGPRGHTVNVSSRIESATRRLQIPILLGGATQRCLPETFWTRRLCQARLRNVNEPVTLFELHSDDAGSDWRHAAGQYEIALERFEQRDYDRACEMLREIMELPGWESDGPSRLLIDAAQTLRADQSSPPHALVDLT